jgi:hypothetical protein
MTEGMSDYRLAGGCCAAFSLLFAVGALALAGWSLSQSLGTRRVAATVVAIDRHIDWDSNGHEVTIHTPVAEYEVAGRTYRCRGMGVSRPSLTHEVGDPVAVLYRVAEPSTGHIDSFVDRWLAPLLVMGLAAIFAVPAYLLLRRRRPATCDPTSSSPAPSA